MLGETRILASDLVYNAGKSLNAAVDIGQVNTFTKFSYYLLLRFHTTGNLTRQRS
jgi:xanthine dehydrogenase molybdopterin-binding subunit B